MNNPQNKKAIKIRDKSSGFVTKFLGNVYCCIVCEVWDEKRKIFHCYTHFGNGFSYRLCIVVLNIDNMIVTLLFFLYILLDFVLIVKKSYKNIILITLNKKIRLVKTIGRDP